MLHKVERLEIVSRCGVVAFQVHRERAELSAHFPVIGIGEVLFDFAIEGVDCGSPLALDASDPGYEETEVGARRDAIFRGTEHIDISDQPAGGGTVVGFQALRETGDEGATVVCVAGGIACCRTRHCDPKYRGDPEAGSD
jgi:hypothetical protein